MEKKPIQGWICEAGELPSQDPGSPNGRLARAMLIQFDSVEDCKAVAGGAPCVLNWAWERGQSSAV